MTEDALAGNPPPDDELVIGIVAALGIDLEELTVELRVVLSEFGYRSHDLHLTNAFADFQWPTRLVEKPFDERMWSYMNAGPRNSPRAMKGTTVSSTVRMFATRFTEPTYSSI